VLRDLLHHSCLGRIDRCGRGPDSLPGCRELGLGTLNGDAERGRIDPVQQIAGPDDLVVAHRNLDHLARDLRDGAHHVGAHAGVARIGRQPISNQRPSEQQDTEDEDAQRPAPQRIHRPGQRRRHDSLLGLRDLQFVQSNAP
jgi:hypothetical protein